MIAATYRLENKLRREGAFLIAGIDEVGRGALAGPLVSACVVLPAKARLKLYDSKSIPVSHRESLAEKIQTLAIGYGIGWVSNVEIDTYGLSWALRESYLRALEDMQLEVSRIILDGSVNYLNEFDICQTIVKADQSINCVAAASIVAKVARDEYMRSLCTEFPYYCFDTNVGYGTKVHREALNQYGLSGMHRKSFCSNLV